MKKFYHVTIALTLTLLSFFYTDKVIDFIRETDPIMKNIKKSNSLYNISATNAKVDDNTIIPGVSGTIVDNDKSFRKMKKYGTYNEGLTVFKEVEPTISIDDYYDKYISQGSGINNDISLVFSIKVGDDVSSILNTLIEKGVVATFFIDGLWLENNRELVSKIVGNGNELEVLSYDNNYEELYFSSSLNMVNSITNLKPKYCLAKYDNKEILNLCKKLELHTVIPTINTGNYPFNEIKKKINKGSIIGMDITSSVKIELPIIIDFIRQKGYVIDTLDNLLSEAGDIK